MHNNKNVDFKQLKEIDIRTVDIETLVELDSLDIDIKLNYEEKLVEYIEQLKNPFLFKVGKFVVKQVFEEDTNSLTIEKCMKGLADN